MASAGDVVGARLAVAVAAHWFTPKQHLAALQPAGSFQQGKPPGLPTATAELLAQQLQNRWRCWKANQRSQSQQLALQAMYQELSRDSDETSLADAEQALELADQQPQTGGQRGADFAAEHRAAPAKPATNRTGLVIRRRRCRRQRHAEGPGYGGISVKIDSLVSQSTKLPLVVEKPPTQPAPKWQRQGERKAGWRGIAGDIWTDIRI